MGAIAGKCGEETADAAAVIEHGRRIPERIDQRRQQIERNQFLDGADQKHPKVQAIVTHDRPITKVEFYRVRDGELEGGAIAVDTSAPY